MQHVAETSDLFHAYTVHRVHHNSHKLSITQFDNGQQICYFLPRVEWPVYVAVYGMSKKKMYLNMRYSVTVLF